MNISNLFARLCIVIAVLASPLTRGLAADGYTLSFEQPEHGTLSGFLLGTEQHVTSGSTVEPGSLVVITATPDEGYLLARMVVTLYTDDASQANTRGKGSDVSILGQQEVEPVFNSETGSYRYLFTMTGQQTQVSVTFARRNVIDTQTGTQGTTDNGRTVTISQTVADAASGTVTIPASLTDAAGNTFTVTAITAGAFSGMGNVKDICLESHDLLTIADPTFDGLATADHGTRIHVYQTLLSPYAEGQLSQLVALRLLVTDIRATNRLFTFSNAHSVELPEETGIYICQAVSGEVNFLQVPTRVIPANTGVLLTGRRTDYMMVATPEAGDRRLFEGNDLVAVTVGCHLTDLSNAYLLKDNAFWKMAHSGAIPDGKAYLLMTK